MKKIGLIGGSGLENLDIVNSWEEKIVQTPFGPPSAALKIGRCGNNEIVFLSRHGSQHTITPTMVNFRANIFALKEYGCDYIIGTTAVGSLKEEIKRGDLVIPDQFIDFTRHRPITFFDKFEANKPMHTPMAEPFSAVLREKLIGNCEKLNFSFHKSGTVITIEGPRFSTKAESKMFRMWGADVINMSTAPEVILSNEVGIPYASIAMSTDYDSWKEGEEPVSWEEISKVFNQNIIKVKQLLLEVINSI